MYTRDEFIKLCSDASEADPVFHDPGVRINGIPFLITDICTGINSCSVFMINENVGKEKILSMANISSEVGENDSNWWIIDNSYYVTDEELLYVFNFDLEDMMALRLIHGSNITMQEMLSSDSG